MGLRMYWFMAGQRQGLALNFPTLQPNLPVLVMAYRSLPMEVTLQSHLLVRHTYWFILGPDQGLALNLPILRAVLAQQIVEE